MTLYALAVSAHVVTAILGLGQIAGTAVLASTGSAGAGTWAALHRLVGGVRWSLLVMLLSGVLVEYLSGGAFHDTWWFRASFAGVLVLAALNGRMGRTLRKREALGDQRALERTATGARIMCALTAVIAAMMEVKQP